MIERLRLRIRTVRSLTHPSASTWAPCRACGRDVETLTPASALELLDTTATRLGVLIASGDVHAIDMIDGGVRICKPSLFSR